MKSIIAIVALSSTSSVFASHLDNNEGVFTNFTYDEIRFKTQTNCQLDTYPEVRHSE